MLAGGYQPAPGSGQPVLRAYLLLLGCKGAPEPTGADRSADQAIAHHPSSTSTRSHRSWLWPSSHRSARSARSAPAGLHHVPVEDKINDMSGKTISIDLDPANLLWLRARRPGRDLSEVLNEILTQIRIGSSLLEKNAGGVRSVKGTIRLPEEDPHLEHAQGSVRELFRRSIERSASMLTEPSHERSDTSSCL